MGSSGDDALAVEDTDEVFGLFEAGARAQLSLQSVEVSALAGYRFGGLDDEIDASLSGGLAFETGLTADLGGAFVGVDMSYRIAGNMALGIGYDGVFGEDVTANYGSVTLEWLF